MPRTCVNIPLNQDPVQLHERIKAILVGDGYSETTYNKTEIVWKKGTGLLTAMHFIKLDYQPNLLVVSGWICSGIGALTFGEKDLSGLYAIAPKKSVQKTVDKIVAAAGYSKV